MLVRNWKIPIIFKTHSSSDKSTWLGGHGEKSACNRRVGLSLLMANPSRLLRAIWMICVESRLPLMSTKWAVLPWKNKIQTATKETCHFPVFLCGNKLSSNLHWWHGLWAHPCKSGRWQLLGGGGEGDVWRRFQMRKPQESISCVVPLAQSPGV